MIEGKGQKWALENIQVRCLIYNSLPWVTLFLVSGWAQSRFAYIQQWSPLILDPSIVLSTEDTSTPVFDSRSNQTSSNQSHTSSTHHRRKPQPSMDFPTTSLNVDPNVGSMFGTMFAQDVNWCDREFFVHLEIRALTFKSKIISTKIPPDPGTTSSDSAVGRKRWQSLWAMPPSLWGELCDVDMWHNGSCWLYRFFKMPAVLDHPPWHWMYSLYHISIYFFIGASHNWTFQRFF